MGRTRPLTRLMHEGRLLGPPGRMAIRPYTGRPRRAGRQPAVPVATPPAARAHGLSRLGVSLAGTLALAGLLAAPGAHAATRIAAPATPAAPTATPAAPTATPAAPTATLALSASATNRGGIVDVTGTGFAPREEVDIKIVGVPGTAATARSDAHGVLSATGVSVPYSL